MSIASDEESSKKKPLRSKADKKDFVLNGLSGKAHDSLSPRARDLKNTMRFFADARTGDLRLPNGHWIQRAQVMRRANIKSKNTFAKYLRELRKAGFAHVTQISKIVIRPSGKRHLVFHKAQYSVSERPRQDWASCVSQSQTPHRHSGPCVSQIAGEGQNASSVYQKLRQRKKWDTNSSQTTPRRGVSGVGSQVQENDSQSSSVSRTGPVENNADDSRDATDRTERLLEEATAILLAKGHDLDYVEEALRSLDQRAFELGKTAASANYYLVCFDTLQHTSAENDQVWSVVKRRREVCDKLGIPKDMTKIKLTEEQESMRQSFNARARRH